MPCLVPMPSTCLIYIMHFPSMLFPFPFSLVSLLPLLLSILLQCLLFLPVLFYFLYLPIYSFLHTYLHNVHGIYNSCMACKNIVVYVLLYPYILMYICYFHFLLFHGRQPCHALFFRMGFGIWDGDRRGRKDWTHGWAKTEQEEAGSRARTVVCRAYSLQPAGTSLSIINDNAYVYCLLSPPASRVAILPLLLGQAERG